MKVFVVSVVVGGGGSGGGGIHGARFMPVVAPKL
jgi:hypothetical protein